MASLLQLTSVIQPFLMLLNNSVGAQGSQTQNITLFNATQNATAEAAPLKMPTDVSSLITFIYSFSALRDYLKLIVLGGALETLRRLYSASYAGLVDRFFITATFESEDLSFGGYRFFVAANCISLTQSIRMDDVLAFFSSSVPSVPGLFRQHHQLLT
jgi:mitochondrial chaperone BCS1